MKVLVEIDLPEEIAEKYDVELRVPREGERFWNSELGGTVTAFHNFHAPHVRLVLVPKFNLKEWWPKWLIAPWIAMDECERWYAYTEEPRLRAASYGTEGGDLCLLSGSIHNLVFPPGFTKGNWVESKLKNPHL